MLNIPHFPRGSGIPRVIRQTFATKLLPEVLACNVDRLRTLNPGFRHELYDDADILAFIETSYGADVLAQFLRIDPAYGAARADLFRYLLMYKSGGVYLDIKATAVAPFEEVLRDEDQFVLSQWGDTGAGGEFEGWGRNRECAHVPGGEFQQWHIIAAPGHPFLRAVIVKVLGNIERYRPWREKVGQVGTLRTTGPRAYTQAIFPLLRTYEHRRVKDEKELGLRYSVFGGPAGHRGLFSTYYRNNAMPVVRPSPSLRLPFLMYSLARGMGRTGDRARPRR